MQDLYHQPYLFFKPQFHIAVYVYKLQTNMFFQVGLDTKPHKPVAAQQ